MVEEKGCPTCGRVFRPMFAATKYCSVQCRDVQVSAKRKEYKQRAKIKKTKKEPKLTIQDIQARARERGMSYGQYVAMMNMPSIRRVKHDSKRISSGN